ncbi:4-(cytidine 5'-diphospho)-2-C-methyl-D-erythritol kinase [Commensalibacter oyaizuii]|uniref:4-diphosphocytidyl-2-C-methyl-D-erythritol kinase n=1 Tax=Commensalibacter oyaizuii TaxID=3043873 RepID=A0ABT6Q1H1_9PROT|nr:4-(cytidine 5'-diphospho)-2-C-methyl-D-erythritol kinase [Commensalibacter sp. TBRC 16381]MDI2090958.1 4-(cytidine 5'-diphospho)-2-C-methyl-D-erythritol kinase [Commensalibacter sp. TBRC 16381]
MSLIMEENAYAKINLYLHVTGKRADGYHLLDSLAVFPEIGDKLTVQAADEDQKTWVALDITGPFSGPLKNEATDNNLIIKAAHRLSTYIGMDLPPVQLHLEKMLPVASGIGGGSADGAAALRLLTRYWNLEIPAAVMTDMALQLGADVPVCMTPVAQRMEGIGEQLSKFPIIPDFGMVLVNHGEAVPTADIFRRRDPVFSDRAVLNGQLDFEKFIQNLLTLSNDLQDAACSLKPEILTVLDAIKVLPFCRFSRMSGSGATCFGIFESKAQAVQAAKLLSERYPSWWIWGGKGQVND